MLKLLYIAQDLHECNFDIQQSQNAAIIKIMSNLISSEYHLYHLQSVPSFVILSEASV